VYQGQIVVSDRNAIRTVDAATNTHGPRHEVGTFPQIETGVGVVGGRLWVGLSDGRLLRMNSSLVAEAELRLPASGTPIGFRGAGDQLWAMQSSGLMLIDVDSMTVAKTVLIQPQAPQALFVGDRLYITSFPLASGPPGSLDPTLFAVDVG
jgi:sugar lactone lactonase YvrE